MKKLVILFCTTIMLCACNNAGKTTSANENTACCDSVSCSIEGSWIKPIEGMDTVDGFSLNANGTAQSINSATLVYKNWSKDSDSTVTLISESIGNGVTIMDTTVWNIKKLDADSLIIASRDITLSYSRKK